MEIISKSYLSLSLLKAYNEMNDRIDGLVERDKLTQIRQLEQQIELIHSRLNPHFLYNTLELIHNMAADAGQPRIASALLLLVELLRYHVDLDDRYIPLREELTHLHKYIAIQDIRYDGRFHVVWEVADDVLDWPVRKLLMQPFVENCFLHAFDAYREDFTVTLRSWREGEDLRIQVEDNGVGMSRQAVLDALNNPRSGIGVYSVNRWVRLTYGGNYGVTITPPPGGGTLVELRLPRGDGDV